MTSPSHRWTRSVIKVVVLAAVLAGVVTVGAAQAAGPVTVTCGQVLTQDTKVANDLVNCPAAGLVIGASNVKLDLRGHLIDGDGFGNDAGIDNTGGFDNVQVTHGTIQEFQWGVYLLGASNNQIDRLETLNNVLGILLDSGSNNNSVERNQVHDNYRVGGILVDGTTGNLLSRNTVYNNGSSGIGGVSIGAFNSTNTEISLNDVFDNVHSGIWLFNTNTSLVQGNTSNTSEFDGIETSMGSTGNVVVGNVTNSNGWNGIDVGDPGNTITGNQADTNFNLGIFAAAGNVDGGGNTAVGNGDPLECVGVTCS
jgi:parallel beta-helix repeat protein